MFLAIKDGAVLLSKIKGNKMEVIAKKEWLTPKEVNEEFKFSVSTLAKWRMNNLNLAFSKMGKYIRYKRDDIINFIESNKIEVAS